MSAKPLPITDPRSRLRARLRQCILDALEEDGVTRTDDHARILQTERDYLQNRVAVFDSYVQALRVRHSELADQAVDPRQRDAYLAIAGAIAGIQALGRTVGLFGRVNGATATTPVRYQDTSDIHDAPTRPCENCQMPTMFDAFVMVGYRRFCVLCNARFEAWCEKENAQRLCDTEQRVDEEST